jgi:hypothetical protein
MRGVRFYPAEAYDSWFSLNKSAMSKRDRISFDDYLLHRYPMILNYLEKRKMDVNKPF